MARKKTFFTVQLKHEELEKLNAIAKVNNTTPAAISANIIREYIKAFEINYTVREIGTPFDISAPI